ncbi:DEAD/DEAH box helicase [Jatrophihabitans telluris]|uniref:DEAD/DEAH box helicase n=1 Tax=Jatrophihabitans telluris TaxID=2038343 RepID=A0ABY4QSH5_9ACTN|nr:DEAD/DEAH box helicase [Jatrophihabitans telluris]UQX86750.1 DEAD/DEAH box helicase [Jatrophihabitans telluris]
MATIPSTLFTPATRAWFEGAFAEPTPAQLGAWESIAAGRHTLVVAPTGSGKTLAAFLSAVDRLTALPAPDDPAQRCRVLYVSPLKALAADVERNLRSPLVGISQAARRLGQAEPDVRVATRSGDTSPEDRRAFARHGADILITTPESLFLLLTSAARKALSGVETVIIDEVHAVAATKRGSHLALSLERLDELLERPAQRIGLSATVRPIEEVANFLAGGRPVNIVQPPSDKRLELSVVVPVEDLSTLGGGEPEPGVDPRTQSSIWPHVESRVLDLIDSHNSTIVFANSRRLAERLTSQLNDLAAERDPDRGAVARAHHGSVSREQRQIVEEDLKAGRLPAVVATSSLELGIDMGAVDLVIQVESPPSVAAGTQRLGRAGHQVGAASEGVIFPKYRGDLVESAVVAERIRAGQIESMRYPRNPLDVLAQHIVSMVAMDELSVDDVERVVRRSAPFASLPHSALEAVLDMLAGRYPSDAFAELRPRLVWDRLTGELTPRGGAQRLAVTSGGTIPDRGMFAVFLAGSDGAGRRVGELDEEMVYESRVGEVFLLGSSSWRIEDITHDRVLVTPAPGQLGKMPFWKGDSIGRPAELGRALGAFVRELDTAPVEQAKARAQAAGLDEWAASNLLGYLADQRAATRQLPTDRTIVVERFRDELGDWRLVIHSPFGAPVNAPWALAISTGLRERFGLDVQSMHSDDGIVLRLADTTAEPPGSDLVVFDPEDIEAIVTGEVTNSALFASRFRECAARSLLLPKRDPRRRSPLWQQRQRAHALMEVAKNFGQFPVVLEAMRECLQDVYDLPGLVELMRQLQRRQIKLVEVETSTPSPFAQSLLFGYVGMFIYDADVPLAERRAQALTLDTSLLAELMGSPDLRDLLDEKAIAESVRDAQRLSESRRVSGPDATSDLLREVGDLTTAEAEQRGATRTDLDTLRTTRRAIELRIGGEQRWLAIEDAGRVRDALGAALPVGVPETFTELVADPLGDLLTRFARTNGPFTVDAPATRLGLGTAVVAAHLERLVASGQVVAGEFTGEARARQYCGTTMLRTIRRKSLAALRREVEPVPQSVLAQFLPEWQGVGGARRSRGIDGLARVIEQLAGVPIPASALESLVLPARVSDYSPAMLDELTSAGEVIWAGHGSLGKNDGWISLLPAEVAPLLLEPADDAGFTPQHKALLQLLDHGQALFIRSLSEQFAGSSELTEATTNRSIGANELSQLLWDLIWSGAVTNDTLAPVRARLATGRTSHSRRATAPRARYGRYSRAAIAAVNRATEQAHSPAGAAMPGRWSQLPVPATEETARVLLRTEVLLDRYGLLLRGEVAAESVPGGFSAVYPVLRQAEETGRYRRGYFVEGMGGAQFGVSGAVDRLREISARAGQATAPGNECLVLAATDPANPYGAALEWPVRVVAADDEAEQRRGHQPGRKAGALVALIDGHCVLYVERGGRTILSFTEDEAMLKVAATALADSVRTGALGRLHVEKADGERIATSPLGRALESAGFRPSPRGLQLRG